MKINALLVGPSFAIGDAAVEITAEDKKDEQTDRPNRGLYSVAGGPWGASRS